MDYVFIYFPGLCKGKTSKLKVKTNNPDAKFLKLQTPNLMFTLRAPNCYSYTLPCVCFLSVLTLNAWLYINSFAIFIVIVCATVPYLNNAMLTFH